MIMTFWTLIKREFWEHRSNFLTIPLVIIGITLLLWTVSILRLDSHFQIDIIKNFRTSILSVALIAIPMILGLITIAMMVQYAQSCLYEERKDKSIFFWRSMPVSDTTTILSKVVFCLIVAPVIAITTWLVILLLGYGIEVLFGSDSNTLTKHLPSLSDKPQQLMAFFISGSFAFLTFSLLMLPYISYLMLASSITKRSPFGFAILPFVLLEIFNLVSPMDIHILKYVLMPFKAATTVANRLFESSMAMLAGQHNDASFNWIRDSFTQQHPSNVLTTIIIGLLLSVGFITASIWARKRMQTI